jgi:hypothetical protein
MMIIAADIEVREGQFIGMVIVLMMVMMMMKQRALDSQRLLFYFPYGGKGCGGFRK